MTVASEVSDIEHAGDGVTVAFAIPFNFLSNSDIEVSRRDSAGDSTVLSTGYAITGAGTGSGTCTFTTAPAASTVVRLERKPQIHQPMDLVSNDSFPAETVETAHDRQAYIAQYLRALIERCIQVPAGDGSIGAGMLLDAASARASKFLAFDTAGNLELASSIGTTALTSSAIATTLNSLLRTAAEIAASVTPTDYAYTPGDVRRYGAVGDGTTDCTTAIQNAINTGHRVYIPNGTWKITSSLDLPSYAAIVFESRSAILKGALAAALIRGLNGTTTRTYGANIYGGTLDNTSKATAGGIGIDWKSMTMAKCYGTIIQNVETGIKNGGSSAQGAFYNEFHGVDITSVVTGIDNGTLGNDNKFFGGRVNDMTTGTRDNDCSGNLYVGVAVETFTTVGHLNSNSAAATNIKYAFSRIENSAGIGIDIRAAAQVCDYIFPQFTTVTTPISDASTTADTHGISDYGWKIRGGTPITKHLHVTVTRDVASLAAGAFRQEGPITVTGVNLGDAVSVALPAAWPNNMMVGVPIVTANNTIYLPIYNPSGGAVDPASGDFQFDVFRH